MSRPTLPNQRDAAQATQQATDADRDPRVYVNVHDLMQYQARVGDLHFLPRQPVHSLLSGRHASRIRGRGLNFEEIRDYHPGDDVRMIDWKVTARTRTPHTRVFTEERDRTAMLVVDQRIGMFYGSRWAMKSVIAAQTAAIAAWRVLDVGDRVGAVVFNDERRVDIRPQRSRNNVIHILKTIVEFNNDLSAESPLTPAPEMLKDALEQVARIAHHDCLVVVVSDMFGFDVNVRKKLTELAYHNDVILGLVHDPSASGLSASRNFVVTDGDLQVELPLAHGQERQKIADASQGRVAEILGLASELPLVTLPLSAGEPVEQQLRKLLGTAQMNRSSRRR